MAMSELSIRALSDMLQQTSTRAQAVQELQLTLHRLLEMFLPDPAEFCALLTDTASVITGHAALWFMLRDEQQPKPRSLTVSCPLHRFDRVYDFLMKLPGASADPYPEDLFLSNDDRVDGLGIRKRMRVKSDGGLIELLESDSFTAFQPIPFQSGTHMMNVLCPGHFISPYAKLTLKGIAFAPRLLGHRLIRHLPIYDTTEFKFHTRPSDVSDVGQTCYMFPACPKRVRTFGDDDCFTVSFTQSPLLSMDEIQMDSTCTAWRLGGVPCGNRRCFLDVERMVETDLEFSPFA